MKRLLCLTIIAFIGVTVASAVPAFAQDAVEDQRKHEIAIEAAGGKIVKPIFEFPGGHRFHFTDPEGYELAVWSET